MLLALPLTGPSCGPAKNDGGIYKTTDGGQNWQQKIQIEGSKETLARADVTQILGDPSNPDVVYIIAAGGIYVSNQFGDSWKKLVPEISAAHTLEFNPQKRGVLFAAVAINERGKIIYSENAGVDWKEIYTEDRKSVV